MPVSVFLAVGLSAGCGALSVPDARPVSSPLLPAWNSNHIRQHLSFLHGGSVRGRVDGTLGYGVATSYVSERLNEYRLQPPTVGDFRILFTTPRNVVHASRVRIGDADSVSLRPGMDFLPDGRSANLSAAISGLGIVASEEPWTGPAVPLLLQGEQETRRLETLRDAGISVVLIEKDDLAPRPASRNVTGLGVLDITRDAADRILAGAQSVTGRPGVLRLRRPLKVEVAAEFDPTASGINVIGYVPGKHPVLAREAVVVCTHLDAVGSFGGVDFIDLGNYGVEVAAILDLARQYASFSRLTRIPERTLIVAFLGGGTIDSGGFRAFLRQPVWDMDFVSAIVYAGAPARGRKSLIAAAGPFGDRLRFVSATDSIPDVVLPAGSWKASESPPGEKGLQIDAADPESYLAEAVRSAEALAERLYFVAGDELTARASSTATLLEDER